MSRKTSLPLEKIAKFVNFSVNFWPPGEIFFVLLDGFWAWRRVLLDHFVLLDGCPTRRIAVYIFCVYLVGLSLGRHTRGRARKAFFVSCCAA